MRLAMMLALTVITTAANADGWLCESEAYSGLRFNRATFAWIPTSQAPKSKYIVQREAKNDYVVQLTAPRAIAYALTNGSMDEPPIRGICLRDMAHGGDHIVCDMVIDTRDGRTGIPRFHMKLDEPRFVYDSKGAFFHSRAELRAMKEPPNEMFTEVGQCKAL